MSQIKKQNLAFLDVETTGLNVDVHEIIQIGIVLVSQDWKDNVPYFEVLEEIDLKIKPERIHMADKTALRINGYDPSEWIFAYTLSEAMQIVSKKTDGAIMVGHNVSFDAAFIEKAFRTTGIPNKMHYHKLDTISIAFAKLHGNKDIDQFSLRVLCQHFGIENKGVHTGLGDARATFQIYEKFMKS